MVGCACPIGPTLWLLPLRYRKRDGENNQDEYRKGCGERVRRVKRESENKKERESDGEGHTALERLPW